MIGYFANDVDFRYGSGTGIPRQDHSKPEGALALLLLLALVLGIYFGFSALFGGDEEPPKQPEPATVRTPPYPRRPSLEDPAPARTPWSQSGPGATDSWSYGRPFRVRAEHDVANARSTAGSAG